MSVRLQASRVLTSILKQEGSLSTQLPDALEQTEPRERPLLQQLCYGTLRSLPRLQLIAEQLLHKPFKRKDSDIQALLLLGLYQLLETRIPPHAAIDETVKVAIKLRKPWAKGVINSVLRNVQRQPEMLRSLEPRSDYRFCHPKWLVTRLKQAWPERYQSILEANNQHPPMSLRVNLNQGTREQYSALLNERGFDHRLCPWSPAGITLNSPVDVDELPGFRQGRASIQDEAAQLAAGLLAPAAGQRVLDACAAPGGKTAHLLETQPQIGECLALDISATRLDRVRENLARIGLDCLLLQADASERHWWDGQPFERILLDAPCSATGVIRRNPDIKYLRHSDDIDTLVALQSRILANLWSMLAPGGRLLYATCSVLPEENEQQVRRFIESRPDASEIPIEADWGIAGQAGRQLFPQRDGHDGFYYALMEKAPLDKQAASAAGHPLDETQPNP